MCPGNRLTGSIANVHSISPVFKRLILSHNALSGLSNRDLSLHYNIASCVTENISQAVTSGQDGCICDSPVNECDRY
jgi:hypothetical protein